MPRPPRNFRPGRIYFVRQRGNNGSPVFRDEHDMEFMRILVEKYSLKYDIRISACSMAECSVHLTVTPASSDGIPRFMQSVIGNYSRAYNRKYSRKGHLWQNRYLTIE